MPLIAAEQTLANMAAMLGKSGRKGNAVFGDFIFLPERPRGSTGSGFLYQRLVQPYKPTPALAKKGSSTVFKSIQRLATIFTNSTCLLKR